MITKIKPVHIHKWVPIPGLEKFPQRLCRCGCIKGSSMQMGENTVTMNPAGATDVVRWSSSATPIAAGDVGMTQATGKGTMFANGALETMKLGTDGDGGRKWCYNQNPRNTTISSVGTNLSPTTDGTAGVLPLVNDGEYIDYTTLAVAGSDGGWHSASFTETVREFCPYFECFVHVGAVATNVRIWIGLFSGDPMGTATPGGSGLHCAAFRFDTSAGDSGNWRIVTSDGVTTNVKALDGTGGAAVFAFTPDTSYFLRISFPLGGAAFFTGSPFVVTPAFNPQALFNTATNLPGALTGIGINTKVRTLDAVAKHFAVSMVSVRQHAPGA